ncbi:MAG: LUD domain-containing protein [Longimicrobiales bacterium]
MSDADRRRAILARVRQAVERREAVDHPGAFGGWRPGVSAAKESAAPERPEAVDRAIASAFADRFVGAGGQVAHAADIPAARRFVTELLQEIGGGAVALGAGVPPDMVPDVVRERPARAAVGVSMARGAVAETGSLILDARDGRAVQLLPPVHVVLVPSQGMFATLADALAAVGADLPSAVGLHSGPSKSADIGKILVTGVHGPGRVVALLVDGLPRAELP